MAEITLKNTAGADAGTVVLDDAMFGIQPNVHVMHQVVTAQLANRRAGTQSTKTRSEVRGGGAKPYRQKGTGNARQGSTRSPHYTGGGVALGPKPRSYAQRTPKKMIKLALRSSLSDRAADGKVVVVDDWGFETPRTKDARAALAALGVEGRALVVVDRLDGPAALSFRNLPEVQLIKAGELNAYDVLCNDWILFERGSVPTAGDVETASADVAAGEPATADEERTGVPHEPQPSPSTWFAADDADAVDEDIADTEAADDTQAADGIEVGADDAEAADDAQVGADDTEAVDDEHSVEDGETEASAASTESEEPS